MTNKCKNCHATVGADDKFCPSCGTPVEKQNAGNVISSSGNYSGKMVKGEKTRGYKILRNSIIAVLLAAVLSLVIWFQVDPDAGKKLTDVLLGIVFMAFFFLVGWFFMRGKKGKSNTWDDDHLNDVVYDDDNND